MTIGPEEASTLGNVLMQLLATGKIRSLEEGRSLIRPFFRGVAEPGSDAAMWKTAYGEYREFLRSRAYAGVGV